MQIRDPHKILSLNTDDSPDSDKFMPGDVTDAFNLRLSTSNAQHSGGNAETLQSEVEVPLNVVAEIIYYGESIGGAFLYEGYDEIQIGSQVWMRKNYDVDYPGSKVYDDDEDNAGVYGRLYTHNQIMSADFVPLGWHIPTEAEYDELLTFLGGEAIAGAEMKEVGDSHWADPNTGAVDSAGFRALPGGKHDDAFSLLQSYGLLWMADEGVPVAPVALNGSEIDYNEFVANWLAVEGATGYYLDVAEDAAFTVFVAGFNGKDVGNVLLDTATGLTALTPYYYRVRAYNEIGASVSSNTQSITTIDAALVDMDGNEYHVVTIGTQEWLVENLKTTHYADGSPIPNLESSNDFTDWFLPSKDELDAMYVNLKVEGVGGFLDQYYQSSSEYNATRNYVQSFNNGSQGNGAKDMLGANYYVRACRSFMALAGTYSLRDTGPAGGLIFYIDGIGTTYYEAAPADDVNSPYIWSNIDNIAIGTTGTAVGTGQANTTAIIGQAGHTGSAAMLCNDLSVGGWINDTTGAYCWLNNLIFYKEPYGALYNQYAVTNPKGLAYFEKQSIQDVGWRVATDADFDTLIAFYGNTNNAGGFLKEVGINHWNLNAVLSSYNIFNALPGGYRLFTGYFPTVGYTAYFHSSDIYGDWTYNGMVLQASATSALPWSTGTGIAANARKMGCSVRCVRDVV